MPRVNLKGMKIAFMMANEGVEQVELTEPWKAVQEAGGQPDLVAPQAGEVQAMNHLDKASRFSVDRTTAEVRPED
jgi:protease I